MKETEKTRKQQELYQKLMECRHCNPKRYGLSMLAVRYEDLYNYVQSDKCDCMQLHIMTDEYHLRFREICSMYRLDFDDVKEYFENHGYIFRKERSDFCMPYMPLSKI